MSARTLPSEAKGSSLPYILVEKWYFWVPLLICLAVMGPRLASAEFGLFDDGVTIASAQRLGSGQSYLDIDAASGRFRPAYWFYYGVIYLVFGANPTAFFAAHTLIWLATTAGLVWLVRRAGGNRLQAGAAGILFVLSGPVFENYYTLSKGEPLQLFWLVMALLCTAAFPKRKSVPVRAAAALGITLLIWLALASKETGIVMLPIGISWLILAWIWKWIWKRKNDEINLNAYLVLACAILAASAVFWIWRSSYISGIAASDGYSVMYSLAPSLLVKSLRDWLDWLRRDFTYFIFLLFFAVVSIAVNRRSSKISFAYLASLAWIAGWFLIFVPWNFKVEYYLLAMAAGCAFFGGLAFGESAQVLRDSRWFVRLGTAALIVPSAAIWLAGLPDNFSNARLQLTMDSANAKMLDYVSKNVPPNGKVFVNLPADNEYVFEIGLHLNHIYNRPDVTVDRFFFQRPAADAPVVDAVVISPFVENKPVLSVRHAFVSDDSARYLESIQHFLGPETTSSFTSIDEFTWKSFHLFRIACPVLPDHPACASGGQLLTSTPLRYGWFAYPYHTENDQVAHLAYFNHGAWTLERADGSQQALQFGQAGDIPLAGDWNGDGQTDIGVYRPDNHTWYLDTNLDGNAEQTLTWAAMQPGDIPLTGDWSGSGSDSPGFFRPSDTSWHIRTGFAEQAEERLVLTTGRASDLPLSGDWNGDGIDTFGVYRADTGEINLENQLDANLDGTDFLLPPGVRILVGRWGCSGISAPVDTLAYIQDDEIKLHPVNCACTLSNSPKPIQFSPEWGEPVAGTWK